VLTASECQLVLDCASWWIRSVRRWRVNRRERKPGFG